MISHNPLGPQSWLTDLEEQSKGQKDFTWLQETKTQPWGHARILSTRNIDSWEDWYKLKACLVYIECSGISRTT